MDEGIVEGCEDAGNTENEFTCAARSQSAPNSYTPSSCGLLTLADLRTERDILGRGALNLLLGSHPEESLMALSVKWRWWEINFDVERISKRGKWWCGRTGGAGV
jgi:hypothetical protein